MCGQAPLCEEKGMSMALISFKTSDEEQAVWERVLGGVTKKTMGVEIDGDHRYDACLRDYVEWEPKIKVGGHLFMHDSRMNRGGPPHHPGSSQVAQEKIFNDAAKWLIVGEGGSLTCARKLN